MYQNREETALLELVREGADIRGNAAGMAGCTVRFVNCILTGVQGAEAETEGNDTVITVEKDGPMGVRQEFHAASWIPEGTSRDYVTYLPCNSALASTWNRELACETGAVLGEETRGRGKDVILGPGVNIKRSPLCGRNFEYFSEDPYLTKELAAPFIRGVQNWDVAACVKHFAANNQETERLWVDVEVDEKALREIYLPAFHDAVEKAVHTRLWRRITD